MAEQHAQQQQQGQQQGQQQQQQAGQTPTQSWTLFVGQIPNDVNEDTLKQLFSAYGLVTESKILMDKIQNKPKGCGFITYADKHGAETAIATLHDTFKLPGSARALIVRYSTKQLAADKSDPGPFKLYISNLSRQTTEDEVRAMFSAYGTLVDDVVVLKDPATGASRGVAFVRYNSRAEAMHAIQALHEQIRDKDAQHLMQVKFAHTASEKKMLLHRQLTGQSHPAMHGAGAAGNMQTPMGGYYSPAAGYNPAYGNYNPYMGAHGHTSYPSQQFGGAGGMGGGHANGAQRHAVTKGPDGANLFVYGIPESYNDQDLSGLFANFGNVINAKVYRDLSTGKSKGFGFVSFDQVGPAVAACGAMDGYLIAGKKMTVKPKTDGNQQQQQHQQGGQQHHHAGQPQQHHGQRQQHHQQQHQQLHQQQHQQQHHQQQQHQQHNQHLHAGQPQPHYQQHHAGQVQPSQSPQQGQQQQLTRNGQQQQQQQQYQQQAY